MAQCGGTVWNSVLEQGNSMMEQWDSVAQCGERVWNSAVEQ